MKTTIDIADELHARARRLSRQTGRPLRQIVEEGLRRVLDEQPVEPGWRLQDCSVGRAGDPNPLLDLSWQDLRQEIYGAR